MNTSVSGVTRSSAAEPLKPVRYRMFGSRLTRRASTPTSARRARRRAGRDATSIAGQASVIDSTSSGRGAVERGDDRFAGEGVGGAPEAGDGPGDDGGEHRDVAPLLAGGRVRDVELDGDAVVGRERVGEAVRVVGEGPGVDDDRRAAAPGGLDRVDELAFMVGLQVLDVMAGRGVDR